MKTLRPFLLCLFACASLLSAQEPAKKHRTVVEITTADPVALAHALSGVDNLRKALGPGNTEVEIVAHSEGIHLLVAKDNSLAERMQAMAAEGVTFSACQNSMNKTHLTLADLVSVARPVDAGVAEVVRKQEAGWSYLKYGN